MQSLDQPAQVPVPFADTGVKRAIPVASQIGIVDGAASYTDGFPPKTFLPLAVGGLPPAGADFNGILYLITELQRWQSAGGLFKFDAAFAASIGGYPKGARLLTADEADIWINTAEDNLTDPDGVSPVGWISYSSSVGASLIGTIQAGTSAYPRTQQDKNREVISIKDFGGIGDGTSHPLSSRYPTLLLAQAFYPFATTLTDEIDWAATQAAITDAIATNRSVRVDDTATFVINRTVNVGRCKMFGGGDGSRFKPTMTDGTPCILVTAGTTFFSFEDFRIDNLLDQANYLTGAVSGQVCTGIKIDVSGGTYASRFHIKNVMVRGCAIGADIKGFIGSIENLWLICCDLGLSGTTMNSVRINARFENNRKDFAITGSNGIHFDQPLSQGGIHQFGLLTSTLDDCDGVVLTTPYLEQCRNSPFITVGGTTECKGVELRGASVGMADNAANDYDVYPIAFDKVNGLHVTGYFSTGNHHNLYSTTANTKNIVDNSTPEGVSVFGPHDISKNLSQVRNHFPNSNFDLWLRGWPVLTVTRCAISQELTLVRRGANACRVTMTAAQTNGSLSFVMNDGILATPLRGKTVTAYAWIWIPNTADFNPNAGSAQLTQPYIQISSTNATPVTTSSISGTHHNARGTWNLYKISHLIQSDSTRIDVQIGMNTAAGSTGLEYLVIDSVFLVEGDGGQDVAVRNGWVVDSAINPAIACGGGMIQRVGGTTIPSDTDMIYQVNDQFWYQTPVAGGSPGKVVTTAGTGGTMVTKALAALGA